MPLGTKISFRPKKSRSPHKPSESSRDHVSSASSPVQSCEASSSVTETSVANASGAITIRKGTNYGIKELYNGGSNSNIDIVFVHGLFGNTYSTWLHKYPDVHWPSELLKEDIPDARVLAFGYDANIDKLWNPASNGRLIYHAENMVGALVRKRADRYTDEKDFFCGS